jgi:FlaG/FlaF family flagellin (archaellin)
MLSTLQFLNSVVNHPLNAHRKVVSVVHWLRWHVGSRVVPGTTVIQFVDQAKLVIETGMRGATENIYTGLYDFEDTAFLLHESR